jgi:two-component system cell cycle sensor histidine kinase PleC
MPLGYIAFFVSGFLRVRSSMSVHASAEARRAAPGAASSKWRIFRSVRAVQEKRPYKPGRKPDSQYQLLSMFVRSELSAAVTTPLLAVIVAMGAMFWAPPRDLLIWLATVFVAKGILISLCRQFARAPRDDAQTPVWRAKITAAEFLYGVCWAGVAFISPDTQSEAAHTFIFATLLAVISMRVLFASTLMPIVYAGTLPMTAAIVLSFLLLDNPF